MMIHLDTNTLIKSFAHKQATSAIIEMIGQLGAGAIGAGASVTSTQLTNAANKEIADAANKTQIQIHEDDRKFNADEAEKARQWNSETEVMKRRSEAGLNVSGVGYDGNLSSASAPSASAPSAPSLSVPTMQAPNVGEAIDALVNLATAPAQIKETNENANTAEKNVKNVESDTNFKIAQKEYFDIQNKWTPQQVDANLSLLGEQTKLTKLQQSSARATILRTYSDVKTGIVNTILAMGGQDMNKESIITDVTKFFSSLETDAKKTLADWQINGINTSYVHGYKFGRNNTFNFSGSLGSSAGSGIGLGSGSSGSTGSSGSVPSAPSGSGSLKGFNMMSLLGLNTNIQTSLNASISAGLSNTKFGSFVYQNGEIVRAISDIIAVTHFSNITKDRFQLLQSIRLLNNRKQLLNEFFSLSNSIDSYITKESSTYLPTN